MWQGFINGAMSRFDELHKPLLTKKDEEYQMLLEVADEYYNQKKEHTSQGKSGSPTENVVREHLLRRGFNISFNPNVTIEGSDIKCDLFLLKSTINPSQDSYAPNDVSMVIEVKNNAAKNQSKLIKESFDKLSKLAPNLSFCVVILAEKKSSANEVTDEKLGNNQYRSFTLVSRRNHAKPGELYNTPAIAALLKAKELKKTGDWEKFVAHVRGQVSLF